MLVKYTVSEFLSAKGSFSSIDGVSRKPNYFLARVDFYRQLITFVDRLNPDLHVSFRPSLLVGATLRCAISATQCHVTRVEVRYVT